MAHSIFIRTIVKMVGNHFLFPMKTEQECMSLYIIYLCKNNLKFQPKSWEPELDCDRKLHNYFPQGYLGVERKVYAGYSLRIFNPRD